LTHILIIGIEIPLGSCFAARLLDASDVVVFYSPITVNTFSAEEIFELVFQASIEINNGLPAEGMRQSIGERLKQVAGNVVHSAGAEIDDVWYFADLTVSHTPAELCSSLISKFPVVNTKKLNYVAVDAGGMDSGSDTRHREISRCLKMHNIEHRIFLTSQILTTRHTNLNQGSSAIMHFLSLLHSFKSEIEERSPQYFDFQALRCVAPPDAALNLITADTASELLIRIAQKERSTSVNFSIVSPQSIPFAVLCENIGIAYGLSVLSVEDFNSLNAIDRSFHERLGDFHSNLKNGTTVLPNTDAYEAAGLEPGRAILDEDTQIALFELICRSQDKALAARKRRVAELPGKLLHKTITTRGLKLNYYVGGSTGTPLVVLNALGQGLEYWYRLIDRLLESHRVIIWEPRGTVSPPPPFGLCDQVDDVDAVLQQEGIDACHLIGWCTGPKVAIDFYLRRPSLVRSMAFLNSTFKCDGSPEELSSPYEQNLDSVCRMVIRKPGTAASVMKTLQAHAESEVEILQETDPEQRSIAVLKRMNEDLKAHVLAPFKTEETTFNYAHQLVDFWSHDVRPKAKDIKVPVLLIGTEYDQVATPEASAAAATLFPDARHVHIRGATHYCLYERPEFVAGLLKTFFADLAAVRGMPCASGAACIEDAPNQPIQSATTSNSKLAAAEGSFL
jgi:pimeloyl-ACP methyl ester carboxylesterase